MNSSWTDRTDSTASRQMAAPRWRWPVATGSALVGLALVASACGSTSASANGPATTAAPAAVGTVRAAPVASLGNVLVNSAGRTLYLFTPDKRSSVTCTGACAQAWPPLVITTATATPGPGIQASLLGTIKSPTGQTQVTYNHWPLYTFVGDSGAGQAKGQGLDSTWFAVTTAGLKAQSPGAAVATTK